MSRNIAKNLHLRQYIASVSLSATPVNPTVTLGGRDVHYLAEQFMKNKGNNRLGGFPYFRQKFTVQGTKSASIASQILASKKFSDGK